MANKSANNCEITDDPSDRRGVQHGAQTGEVWLLKCITNASTDIYPKSYKSKLSIYHHAKQKNI